MAYKEQNFGSATDAIAIGDMASGVAGGARFFYDQSIPTFTLYDLTGAVSVVISQVAGTATVFNEAGADTDFRVEGDTDANLFFVDASADFVGVGTNGPTEKLHVQGSSAAGDLTVYIVNTDAGATSSADLRLKTGNSANVWRYGLEGNTVYIGIVGTANYLAMTSPGTFQFYPGAGGSFVWNENGVDSDFRIEGDTNANLIFLDASIDAVIMGAATSATNARLTLVDAGMTQSYLFSMEVDDEGPYVWSVKNGTYGASVHRAWMSNAGALIFDAPTVTLAITIGAGGGVILNDGGADADFRVEGDTTAYMLFLDATSTTENIALLTTAAPNWQSMDRGLFIGNADTAPSGNPSAGHFYYSNSGVPTWRNSSGVVFLFSQATGGENLTNNVTAGGTDGTIADFAAVLYATDAGTIRNDIYQLARALKQDHDQLRAMGILT